MIDKINTGYKFTTTDGVSGEMSVLVFGIPSPRVGMWLK